jgi:hypothetical protein
VHRRRQAGQEAAAFQALPDRLGCQPRAVAPDEQGRVRLVSVLLTNRQPARERFERLAAHRHRAPLAAFAQHVGFARLQIDPAARLGTRRCVQAGQFSDPQAAAVQQFNHGSVARFEPRVALRVLVTGQLDGFVHAERLGQRLGRFRCAHILHGIARHQALASQPGIEAAPT